MKFMQPGIKLGRRESDHREATPELIQEHLEGGTTKRSEGDGLMWFLITEDETGKTAHLMFPFTTAPGLQPRGDDYRDLIEVLGSPNVVGAGKLELTEKGDEWTWQAKTKLDGGTGTSLEDRIELMRFCERLMVVGNPDEPVLVAFPDHDGIWNIGREPVRALFFHHALREARRKLGVHFTPAPLRFHQSNNTTLVDSYLLVTHE